MPVESFTLYEYPNMDRLKDIINSHRMGYIHAKDQSKLRAYYNEAVKNGGKVAVTYKRNIYNGQVLGRAFAKTKSGICCQTMWNALRSELFGDRYLDIDIVNCNASILKILCDYHLRDLDIHLLKEFLENRDKFYNDIDLTEDDVTGYNNINHDNKSKRDLGKYAYNMLMYGSSKQNISKIIFCGKKKEAYKAYSLTAKFCQMIHKIQDGIVNVPDLQYITKNIQIAKRTDKDTTILSLILGEFEFQYVNQLMDLAQTDRIEIGAYVFDGFIIKTREILQVSSLLNNYNVVKFIIKSWSTPISQLTFTEEIKEDLSSQSNYDDIKREFEKSVFFVDSLSKYICIIKDEVVFKDKSKLIASYEHMKYTDDFGKEDNFLKRWMVDDTKKIYASVGSYPCAEDCPHDVYNMWIPFKMESIENYVEDKAGLEMILQHIDVLCNHEPEITKALTMWLAHIVQKPEEKSFCINLNSSQGAGKGTLFEIMEKILGQEKVFITSDPKAEVFGGFAHPKMKSALLVLMDEISASNLSGLFDKIKFAITNLTINLNFKNESPITIDSYHRYMTTSNNLNPIKVDKSDRRNLMIECSDELIGNVEYFTKMRKIINSVDSMKTFYEYLKALDLSSFNPKMPPMTAYKRQMIEANRDIVEVFIDHLLSSLIEDRFITSEDLYTQYKSYCAENGFEFVGTSIQFGMKVSKIKSDRIGESQDKKINGKTKRGRAFKAPICEC